ncbi:MAG: UdgX family uracil-DNA binding protein, partial [Hyphomicrobiales bacterium]
ASIFNPARLKVKAMTAEMPKKYWPNLPEAKLIPGLVEAASRRTDAMVHAAPTSAPARHARVRAREEAPADLSDVPASLKQAREAAEGCRRCPLWKDATQTVFGEGAAHAPVMFVGEQPGDQEDLAGKPFVGPAGQLFDRALDEAGLEREKTYVTNAVKHFKFVPRGKKRIHQKPNAGEIEACRWWLDNERRLVKPKLIVALGATAVQSLIGGKASITSLRGRPHQTAEGDEMLVTVHPSYLLRIPDEEGKRREYSRFVEDLKRIVALVPEVAAA